MLASKIKHISAHAAACACPAYAPNQHLVIWRSHKPAGLRFIWAFGGTGLFTFLTATSGLIGVAANSPRMLGLYSVLLCTLLLGQAFLGVAFFADDTWRKHLPPDASGEATEVNTSGLAGPKIILVSSGWWR